MEELKKWVLTHDSHELKKGEFFEGNELPAWLVGKAVPVTRAYRQLQDIETENELREEIEVLTNKLSEKQTLLDTKETELQTATNECEVLKQLNTDLQSQIKALKKG